MTAAFSMLGLIEAGIVAAARVTFKSLVRRVVDVGRECG